MTKVGFEILGFGQRFFRWQSNHRVILVKWYLVPQEELIRLGDLCRAKMKENR